MSQAPDWINPRLRGIWPKFWPERDSEAMVRDVEERLEAAVRAWDLSITGRIDTGWVSAVFTAEDSTGRQVVLKAAPDHEAMRGEVLLAKAITVHVPLLDQRDQGMTLLLEKADPGEELTEHPPAKRLQICGELAREIHSPAPIVLRGLSPALPAFEKVISASALRAPQDQYFDLNQSALEAGARAAELLADHPLGLCHGDLHGGNVLRHRNKWQVIDGKGWIGPLAFECLEVLEVADRGGRLDLAVAHWSKGAALSTQDVWLGVCARAVFQLNLGSRPTAEALEHTDKLLSYAAHAARECGL